MKRRNDIFPPGYRIALCALFVVTNAAYAQPEAPGFTKPVTGRAAPKRHLIPASIPALPGLKCQLYPTGRDPSAGLTVFTDDDAYARFHAVQATAGDAVQRLTLDCTDSEGRFSSYPVDLTAADTFVPRVLNLANERGSDRPALTGDPIGYTQLDLIEGGYGLRPDAGRDPAAYSRWLAAASLPGRLLEAKPPSSTSHTVTNTTAAPWTGSVITGAPNYIGVEGNFNVPTAVGRGDETTTTEIAIWNGLGGFGTGSGLIQGGVEVQTIGVVSLYGSFREYCCGDTHSNGYGGAFVPNPGDTIYSQEWYCDSKGNLNLNGGYGCTHLHDLKTGAILNCTSATGSPCWSVPALPLCSVSPGTPNCMTLGLAAESIIELQGPAFTDLASQVTMTGSAYSSETGSYSQTISTDPTVYLLEDFTQTTSHMNVSLGTTNQTYFNVSQFARVGGVAINGALNESIAVGPNANGSNVGDPWLLGTAMPEPSNYQIYHWENSKWVVKTGSGTQIAVSPQGYAWVITNTGQIYYWNGSSFVAAPGNACATWLPVGPNAYGSSYGDPWILGCHEGGSGYNIYQLQGSTWVQQTGEAVKIAVGGDLGFPWVINKAGSIYFWNAAGFVPRPGGACATRNK